MGRKILSKKCKKNKLSIQTGGMPTADVDNVFIINAHGSQCLYGTSGFDYFTMPEGLQIINFGEVGSTEHLFGLRILLPKLAKNIDLRKQFITASRRDETLDYLKTHPIIRFERNKPIRVPPTIKHYYKRHKGVHELLSFQTTHYEKNKHKSDWNKMRENAAPNIKLSFSDSKYAGMGIYRIHKYSNIPLFSRRSNVTQKISYDGSIKFDPPLSRDPTYIDLVGSEEWNKKLYKHLSRGKNITLYRLIQLIKEGELSDNADTFKNATFILHTCRGIRSSSIYELQPKASFNEYLFPFIDYVAPRNPLHPKNKRLLAKSGVSREQIELPRQDSLDAQEGLLTADVDESEYEIIDKSSLKGGKKFRKNRKKRKSRQKRKSRKSRKSKKKHK